MNTAKNIYQEVRTLPEKHKTKRSAPFILKAIREEVNSDAALGSERFKDEIEATLARSVRLGTPGRPRKKGIDEGMSKRCGLGLKGK